MEKLISIFPKVIAGLVFIVLLALNVQVESAYKVLDIGNNTIQKANAGNCPPGGSKCAVYVFPDGKKYWEYGEVIVVTPEEE